MPLYNLPTRVESAGDVLTAGGEAVCDRRLFTSSGSSYASGAMHFSYFTAQVSETILTAVAYTSGTAAATVTLIRYGIYSVASNGDLTLVASTANDTALLAVTNTRYAKALSAPWSKVAGQRYAVSPLVVATTMPTYWAVAGQGSAIADAVYFQEPKIGSVLTGQTDLPASVANASLAVSRRTPYMEFLTT